MGSSVDTVRIHCHLYLLSDGIAHGAKHITPTRQVDSWIRNEVRARYPVITPGHLFRLSSTKGGIGDQTRRLYLCLVDLKTRRTNNLLNFLSTPSQAERVDRTAGKFLAVVVVSSDDALRQILWTQNKPVAP